MMFLVLFVVQGLLTNASLLDDSCNKCGCDFTVFKKLIQLEEEMETLKEALKEATDSTTCKNVAFRTQLTKDLGSVSHGRRIVYDRVELNLGNAFQPSLGVFTAPCSGTYLFSITIGNMNRGGAVHLKKNDITIEYAWAGYNSGWDMGGVTTVAKLNAGDNVWVEGRRVITGASGNDGIGAYKTTGFAGTLLHVM